jgi:hypothetical protein
MRNQDSQRLADMNIAFVNLLFVVPAAIIILAAVLYMITANNERRD